MSVLSKFLFSFGVGIIIITIAIPLMIGCVLLAQKILKDENVGLVVGLLGGTTSLGFILIVAGSMV